MYREVKGQYPMVDREMYDYYRKNRRTVSKGLNQFMLWEKAIKGVMKLMKKHLIKNEEGIYIEGFGYFYFAPTLERRKRVSLLKYKMRTGRRVRCILEDNRLKDKYIFNTGNITIHPDTSVEYKENYDYIKYIENINIGWKN